MSSHIFKLIHFRILKSWPHKLCKISLGLYGGSHVWGQLMSSSLFCHLICTGKSPNFWSLISKTFDLNDKYLAEKLKMSCSITFQKFGPLISITLFLMTSDEINQFLGWILTFWILELIHKICAETQVLSSTSLNSITFTLYYLFVPSEQFNSCFFCSELPFYINVSIKFSMVWW